jgi:hypothetical protein
VTPQTATLNAIHPVLAIDAPAATASAGLNRAWRQQL